MPHGREHRLKRVLDAINLSVVERQLRPHYVKWERGDGVAGRPPHNPVGLVVAMHIQLVRGWTREGLVEFLEDHEEWVRWLGLESVPDKATWSHLLDRVPQETLDQVLAEFVKDLKGQRFLFLGTLAGDGSFIPGCAKDDEAEWGYVRAIKKGRATPRGFFIEKPDEGIIVGKGYRLHVLVDCTHRIRGRSTIFLSNYLSRRHWVGNLKQVVLLAFAVMGLLSLGVANVPVATSALVPSTEDILKWATLGVTAFTPVEYTPAYL